MKMKTVCNALSHVGFLGGLGACFGFFAVWLFFFLLQKEELFLKFARFYSGADTCHQRTGKQDKPDFLMTCSSWQGNDENLGRGCDSLN